LNKREIQTIVLQEEKIQELTERCRQLQMGYDSIWDQNKKLRGKLNEYEGQGNNLRDVNT